MRDRYTMRGTVSAMKIFNTEAAMIGFELLAQTPADGYTIAMGSISTPEEFSAYLRREMEKWGKVIQAAGVKSEWIAASAPDQQ